MVKIKSGISGKISEKEITKLKMFLYQEMVMTPYYGSPMVLLYDIEEQWEQNSLNLCSCRVVTHDVYSNVWEKIVMCLF